MSAITIDNDLVHYEVLGRGRPVILIHSWLGSWRYWIPAMQQLNMKYRTYALDMWGFGDSGKDAKRYDFESQIALLEQFMEKLGITKAALVGHGLGAAVVARYAVRHPDRVPRLMVVSPPLFRLPSNNAQPLTANPAPAERTSAPAPKAEPKAENNQPVQPEAETMPFRSEDMKARIRAALEQRVSQENGGKSSEATPGPKPPREAAVPPSEKAASEKAAPSSEKKPIEGPAKLPDPLTEIPAMPKMDYGEPKADLPNPLKDHLQALDPLALLEKHVEAGSDLEKLKVEVGKADRDAVVRSIESYAGVDTLRDIKALMMPVVTVYGSQDTLLPPPDVEMLTLLKEGRTSFHAIAMDGNHHFPMLENSAQFTRLLMDFLEITDVTKLEIKQTWERRVR